MRDIVCNTSPLQYLHQLGLIQILQQLSGQVMVPPAVCKELAAGRALSLDLPDPAAISWMTIRTPDAEPVLPLVTDLGAGEVEVLALALEHPDAVAVIDDGVARRVAHMLGISFTGTLGVLLDAKKAGLVEAVTPAIDKLEALRFRLDPDTRSMVVRLAGESS